MRVRAYIDDGRYIIVEATEFYDHVKLHTVRSRKVPRKEHRGQLTKAYTHNVGDTEYRMLGDAVAPRDCIAVMFADLADALGTGQLTSVSMKVFKSKLQVSWNDGDPRSPSDWHQVTHDTLIGAATLYVSENFEHID